MQAGLLFVSGWAFGGDALAPVAREIGWPSSFLSVAELSSPGQSPGAVLAERIQGPAVIVGWSMGGMAAIETASLVPGSVRALVLMGTTPRFCAGSGFSHGFPEEALLDMTATFEKHPRAALSRFLALATGASDPQTVESALALGTNRLREGLRYLMRADLRPLVDTLQLPVLVCHGKKDRVVPWRAGQWIADRVAGAERGFFADRGHDLPVREPGHIALRVREFLQSRSV